MLRVLQSFSALRDTTNPYLKQLYTAAAADDVTVDTFSWRTALAGRFDVLHLHWPDVLLRGNSPVKTWWRRIAFAALLLRIRIGSRALVRTLHNLAPHEPGSAIERWLLAWCDRSTTLFVSLVPSTPLPPGGDAPRRTILHGDYRDWFADFPVPATVSGRLLFFGLIRPYKGVDELLGAFSALPDPDLTLRLAGSTRDRSMDDAVAAAVAGDPRISARLEYLGDADLAGEIGCAELVVLPYRAMHNSGSALLALSLNRPILVPANEVTADLAEEVGPGWVFTFDGTIDAGSLQAALSAVRGAERRLPPDLSARTWELIGAQHRAAYREAAALARHRRGNHGRRIQGSVEDVPRG